MLSSEHTAPDNCCASARSGARFHPPTPTRRAVLRGAAVGSGMVIAATATDAEASTRFSFGEMGIPGDVIVVLSLRGGFDGLSAVAPVGDPNYAAARPTLAVPKSQALQLNSIFGLHPALAPLLPFWQQKKLAIVRDVGQENPTRSHFEAMSELERAAPGTSLRTGWLDRALGSRDLSSAFQGAQVGNARLPDSWKGAHPKLALANIDAFGLWDSWDAASRNRLIDVYRSMYKHAPEIMATPAAVALDAVSTTTTIKGQEYTPGRNAVYPPTGTGKALRDVARLIRSNVGLQFASVDVGDWDLHAAMGRPESGAMTNRLDDFAMALAAFATDLGDGLDRVTVITLSEFGRRVHENASGGTDHGHGNSMFVLGGGVLGGQMYGQWGNLTSDWLINGDLPGTTDYRQVLAEVFTKRCGLSSAEVTGIFPGLKPEALGILSPLGA
jgi:uncharacterized protein (DUF1501 family)